MWDFSDASLSAPAQPSLHRPGRLSAGVKRAPIDAGRRRRHPSERARITAPQPEGVGVKHRRGEVRGRRRSRQVLAGTNLAAGTRVSVRDLEVIETVPDFQYGQVRSLMLRGPSRIGSRREWSVLARD